MAALGDFSNAIFVSSRLSIGKRFPTNFANLSSNKKVIGNVSNSLFRTLSGTVVEKSQGVSRVLMAFAEDTIQTNENAFLGQTVSDSDGNYTFNLGMYSGHVSIVCLDGNFDSKLAVAINSTDTTVVLADVPETSLDNLFILIGSEFMIVTSGGTTNTLTVTRGSKGTTPVSHALNAPISKISLNSRIFSKLTAQYE